MHPQILDIETLFRHQIQNLEPPFTSILHSPSSWIEPRTIRSPVNSWTPTKCLPSGLAALSTAPAIGGPIRLAIEEILCAIPRRVPSTFGSGQTTGNMLGGSGTKGPENAPGCNLVSKRSCVGRPELTIECTEYHESGVTLHSHPC